jgi:hypothetical protein
LLIGRTIACGFWIGFLLPTRNLLQYSAQKARKYAP